MCESIAYIYTYTCYFLETTPLLEVSQDDKVLSNINKFRDLMEALPAGVITVGSFFHPHLAGTPKLPFILPVREVLKSKFFNFILNSLCLILQNLKSLFLFLYKGFSEMSKPVYICYILNQ